MLIDVQEGENPLLLMIYDSNQRPDEFSYSDSVSDDTCIQPSAYVAPPLLPHSSAIPGRLHVLARVHCGLREPVLRHHSQLLFHAGSSHRSDDSSVRRVGLDPDQDELQRDDGESDGGEAAGDDHLAHRLRAVPRPPRLLHRHRMEAGRGLTVQNSKARYRGTTHVRNVDYALEVLVLLKLVSSVLRSIVIWYLLLNNSINILPLRRSGPSLRPFVEFMNSFLYSFVDDILLVLLFLLACGWQISHQLFTVVCVAPAERLEEGDPVRRVHLFRHVHSLHDLVLLRFADRRPVQRVHRG